MSNNSLMAQRAKILAYLKKHGSATTIDIRHILDVMAPAARIFELRHDFLFNIVTDWDVGENPEGGAHSVARYFLKPGVFKSKKRGNNDDK